jgi:glycosyltransferase involved in cell wall biosynthesis
MTPRPLRIFVQYASELLTDFESHGDGLICFSLLNGLAERGHDIFAYTSRAALRNPHPRLHVHVGKILSPSSAIGKWEHAWRANHLFAQLDAVQPFDLVWRMHPYGTWCVSPPRTDGRPLVIGPLFYGWPSPPNPPPPARRFGVGIWPLLEPFAARGWNASLRKASLLICATAPHAAAMKAQYPQARVMDLPVIVDSPTGAASMPRQPSAAFPTLAFTGNLVENKRPALFCEIVQRLHAQGIPATGLIIGDGPLRAELEAFASSAGLSQSIKFLGRVPNTAVYDLVATADFLVSTSIGEPYGRAIVEAMAVGTPAICHNSGGPADIIQDDVDGLLSKGTDAQSFAQRIAAFCDQKHRWQEISDACLKKATNWRKDIVLGDLECSLQKLVGEASAAGERRGGQ